MTQTHSNGLPKGPHSSTFQGFTTMSSFEEMATTPLCFLTLTCQRLKMRPVKHNHVPNDTHLDKMYRRGEFLGKGTYGVVIKAENLTDRSTWAIKIVNKVQGPREQQQHHSRAMKVLEREITILKMVDHPHIIQLKEVFETPQKVYLILEWCPQGLRDLLRFEGTFSEEKTRVVIQRLLSVISYLHRNGIVHRDLKLENILVGNNPKDAMDDVYIKVTDFGLSVVKGGVGHESMLHCICGTPAYMAPEIIQDKTYSQQCDIWAAGIIMYLLLSGSPPFSSDNLEELYQQVTKGHINFDHICWNYCSNGAKNLIQGMLRVDPAYRLTANEILNHPWILGNTINEDNVPKTVFDLMKQWKNELNSDIISKHPQLYHAKHGAFDS